MKKTIICALNAKYIHSSLAIRYLQKYSELQGLSNISLIEMSINDTIDNIVFAIYAQRPDILAFSCYIWNISYVHQIVSIYKKISPDTTIILGGPEVSYDAEEVLVQYPDLDYIIRGEGELTFAQLLWSFQLDKPVQNVQGISYRLNHSIQSNPDRPLIQNLDEIPFPYGSELPELSDKVIYYESNRGCPFNCSYCLSSTIKGVRYFSMERVKQDLLLLLEHQVREVKFVDRSFNCNEDRAIEIMKFIIDNRNETRFHCEIEPRILSNTMLDFLKTVPPDLFNFEIGIQSTYPPALHAVRRKSNWEEIKPHIADTINHTPIHIHLDLIAGLPYESYESFKQSFNDVFSLHADVVQLGFLKLLKGAQIREECIQYAYAFRDFPPYEVLSNRFLQFEELMRLHRIEELVDRYYNAGLVPHSTDYMVNKIYTGDAFAFFECFAAFWERKALFDTGHKREKYYTYLMNFVIAEHPLQQTAINDLLKYDYLVNNHKFTLPEGIYSCNPENLNELIYDLLKNKAFMEEQLPEIYSKSHREIRKMVHLEYFENNPFQPSGDSIAMPIFFVYDLQKKMAIKTIPVNETFLTNHS